MVLKFFLVMFYSCKYGKYMVIVVGVFVKGK